MAKRDKSKTTKKTPKKVKKDAKSKKANSQKKKEVVLTKNNKDNSALKQTVKKVMRSTEKKKKTKSPVKKSPLSSSQQKDLSKLKVVYDSKSTAELKAILKLNTQVMTGTKADLVERCAQGKLLGALPNCPKCFGGKLRFDLKKGEYRCPGFMDDTDFVFCKFSATSGITRNQWQD
jgi:hypothetical protein